jgi:hypothetical protein
MYSSAGGKAADRQVVRGQEGTQAVPRRGRQVSGELAGGDRPRLGKQCPSSSLGQDSVLVVRAAAAALTQCTVHVPVGLRRCSTEAPCCCLPV